MADGRVRRRQRPRRDSSTGIFGGKVDPVSLDILVSAVARRWTVSRDLGDVLEHLSEVAIVRSAGAESARLADELHAFAQAVNDNPSLRDALSDPARSVDDKATLVRSSPRRQGTAGNGHPGPAGAVRHLPHVAVALATYQQVAAQVHDERVATVRVAHPLADAERQRLSDALSRQYDRSSTSMWWSTPTSSAASVSRSVTMSSTAPCPAVSTTPAASWPAE